MADYPIVMKQKNDQGQYDNLYPKTLSTQIEGNIPSTQITGTFPSTSITGTFPASQITGLPTSLPANGGNADTVGGQSVQQIIQSALAQGMKIETGSYVGTGTTNQMSLSFNFSPKIVFISKQEFPFVNDLPDNYAVSAILYYKNNWYQTNSFTFYRDGSYKHFEGYFGYGECNFVNNQITWRIQYTSSLEDGTMQSEEVDEINNMNENGETYNYIAIG